MAQQSEPSWDTDCLITTSLEAIREDEPLNSSTTAALTTQQLTVRPCPLSQTPPWNSTGCMLPCSFIRSVSCSQ
ncbi:DNA topoisomerase [Trichinella spiralis]|uniref:DNA topoisomerase n=1 Tax=Trichinella spiralis TaxID=6334 RepID=A0ABR3KNC1_TRISP